MKQEPQIILCPYCGHVQTVPENAAVPDQCDECKGLFEPLSRRATQISMGPWYIRDKKNPFRPGCSYEVLSKMAKNNRIKPTTVMRGPSTKQFWSVARNVPGIAHLLGYCHQCSGKVSPTDAACTACGAKFEEPKERNELGLAYRTTGEAAAAQRALEKEIAAITGAPVSPGGSGISPAITPSAPGASLLDEVLGSGNKFPGSPLLNFGSQPATAATAPPMPRKPAAPMGGDGGQPNFASGFKASPAAAATTRAVDAFSLGGEADDTGVDQIQRKQRTASTMTWALIGFNALLIIVVIALFILNKGKPANALNDDPTPANDNTPSKATGSSNTNGNNTVASNTGSNNTTPAPRRPSVDPFAEPEKPGPASKVPSLPLDPRLDRTVLEEKLTKVREMFDAGEYEAVLPEMRKLTTDYPKAWLPENFDQQIAKVAAELDRRAQVTEDKRMGDEVLALVAKATEAQAKKDHATALKLLTQIRDNYPPKLHPTGLAAGIAAQVKALDGKKDGKFFGQSTE